jgi:hypothetical protein
MFLSLVIVDHAPKLRSGDASRIPALDQPRSGERSQPRVRNNWTSPNGAKVLTVRRVEIIFRSCLFCPSGLNRFRFLPQGEGRKNALHPGLHSVAASRLAQQCVSVWVNRLLRQRPTTSWPRSKSSISNTRFPELPRGWDDPLPDRGFPARELFCGHRGRNRSRLGGNRPS